MSGEGGGRRDGQERGDGWSALRRARSTPPPTVAVSPWSERAVTVPEPSRPSLVYPSLDEEGLRVEMRERFALGDFSSALRAAELLLGHRPEDEEAARFAEACRGRLEDMAIVRLGGPSAVLEVAVAPGELRWLGLDSRAAFVLSRIDGVHPLEQLLDTFGMPRLEALRVLLELEEAGAVRRR